MTAVPWVEIDHEALRHNLGVVRRQVPGSRVMAVIKANAYGHGLLAVASSLQDVDAFAVARIDEAVQLRQAGVSGDILVLSGVHDAHELRQASDLDVQVVVHHETQLALLAENVSQASVNVWLKLDTGMNRLGFPPRQAASLLQDLDQLPNVIAVAGIMTHLANADDLGDDFTHRQLQRFAAATDELPLPRSIANSAGILAWPDSHADWVRPGIMLYGASPFTTPVDELQPVMTFGSRVIAVKTIQAGEAVGYGGIWQAPQAMPVAVVAAGYGDGYPREMPGGTPVLLNGRKVPLIGRVSMDTLVLDLRTQPEARVGDEVIFWGRGLPAETIAAAAGTIPYTLFCGITDRVQRRSS